MMAGEQDERLSAGTPSTPQNSGDTSNIGIAAGAFGFYLAVGIPVALVIVGLVFLFQR